LSQDGKRHLQSGRVRSARLGVAHGTKQLGLLEEDPRCAWVYVCVCVWPGRAGCVFLCTQHFSQMISAISKMNLLYAPSAEVLASISVMLEQTRAFKTRVGVKWTVSAIVLLESFHLSPHKAVPH
jgi:hypothetical protein